MMLITADVLLIWAIAGAIAPTANFFLIAITSVIIYRLIARLVRTELELLKKELQVSLAKELQAIREKRVPTGDLTV